MKHKALFLNLLIVQMAALCALLFASCGNNDEPDQNKEEKTQGEWYIAPYAASTDFKEVNYAIDCEELLSDYGSYGKHYAEPDFFFENYGRYDSSAANFGRLRGIPSNTWTTVVHVVDESTMEIYYNCCLYRINDIPGKKFKVIDAGNLGILCYSSSDSPIIYTYVKTQNKYILSNGTIYTKFGDSLAEDGTSTSLTRFTPDFSYEPEDNPSKPDSSNDAIPQKGALDLDGYVLSAVRFGNEEYTFEYDSKGRLIKTSNRYGGEEDVYKINYEKKTITYTSDGDVTKYQVKFKPTGQITYMKDVDSSESWSLEYDRDKHLQKVIYIDSYADKTEIDFKWDQYGRLPSINFSYNDSYSGTANIVYGKVKNDNGQFSYSLSCAMGKDFDCMTELILAGLFGKAPVREVKEIDGYSGVFFHSVNQYYNGILLWNEYLDDSMVEYEYQ